MMKRVAAAAAAAAAMAPSLASACPACAGQNRYTPAMLGLLAGFVLLPFGLAGLVFAIVRKGR